MTRAGMSMMFVLIAASVGVGQGAPPQPRLSCSFIAESTSVSDAARFSNLSQIPLQASLTGPLDTSDELRLAPRDGVVGVNGLVPTLDIVVVRRSTTGARERVISPVSVTGMSTEPDLQALRVMFEVPIDAARRRNIEQFLTKIERAAAADPKTARFLPVLHDRASAVTAFEQMYVENVPGNYELSCRYTSRRPDRWNGTLESAPLKFQIINDGMFFDQPAFRDGKP